MGKVRIGMLPENPVGAAVYRRDNGLVFLRLNERFHVKVRSVKNGCWVGDGFAEEIDPDEEVEVIQRLKSKR